MVQQELLDQYSNSIKSLKRECIDAGMTEEEFKKLYFESLHSIKKVENIQNPPRLWRKYFWFPFGLIIILCILYHKTIYSCISCNLQDFIYPGLKLLRRISIPIISLFPSLTEFYHETCLIQNPFFTVVDMDCWPCSTVSNIREIYDPIPINQQNGAPYVYETDQKIIDVNVLQQLYTKYKNVFDNESTKVLANNKYYISTQDMFQEESLGGNNLYIWKFNNMNLAKIVRQIIPRPKVVPKFGQSTERFILIDSSQQSFRVPDTECSFSFLLSLKGSRTVELVPAEECKHQCKVLKVNLKETYLLWYNWWYWRPVVQSSLGNTTFVAHVGSYC